MNIVSIVIDDIKREARTEGRKARAAEGVVSVELNANVAFTDDHPLALVVTSAGSKFVRHEDLTKAEKQLGRSAE